MNTPAAYDDFIALCSELESDEFLEDLSEKLGMEIEALVQNGFRTATAPNGQPWAPRKLARGRSTPPHLPLDKSGEMKGSFHVETNKTGVRVTNPVIYSGFQNYGTRFIDARPMLPGADGLGTWEQPLREVAQDHFNSKLNGAT